ncbi:ArdC-like ssDNA-binding domain-containing protein [Exiguobacterium sp. s80]|uniref:ArdC-like ssDNA-binding domain-containing protein n=1 Tax=Exiguobacterium sp. s80 TaxID=2751209 RepID=UPI001BE5E04B|nr:ArdC-like ssDNA-binding domain-containing protein [Exiguobacterium sp. s80]
MAYKKKTREDYQKEVQALTDKMETQLASHFVSQESIKEHLDFMSRFHRYSTRNMLLIEEQFQGARAVGSYAYWEKQGVQVQKGEKGIKIFVPSPVTFIKRETEWVAWKDATKTEQKRAKEGSLPTRKAMYYKIGHVFEYTQTDAREKGLEVSELFASYHRNGSLREAESFRRALNGIAETQDVKILDQPLNELDTAKGCFYPELNAIALNPRNSDIENVTILIHELAHANLHNMERNEERGIELKPHEKEFQAEMVAYTVAAHFGFPTDEFSLSYLANWTQGRDLRDKEDLLHEVHQTSGHFIREIHASLEQEQILEREASPIKMIEYIEQKAQITEHGLPLAERLERIMQHSSEDVGAYLTSIAKQDTQQDLSSFDEPMMLVHGATDFFEPFAKANDRDFDEHETVAYTLVIPGEEPISQHFRILDDAMGPYHHILNTEVVSKETEQVLEKAWYDEMISTEDRDLEKVRQIVTRHFNVPEQDFRSR